MLAPLTAPMAIGLLTPSARVLVASALPGHVDAAALPWDQVHWPTLVAMMVHERAARQVRRVLDGVPELVPDDVQRTVQGLERVARFRAAELSDAAGAVVDALAAAAVPVLWLKGAALAMQQADGFGVRAMGDLDLLLAPTDVERARAALCAAGWTAPVSAGYESHHHEAPMVRADGLRLELHTALFPPNHPFAADSASDWMARGAMMTWGQRTVRVLPPAWHVVHAATHWAWNHVGTEGSWQFLHDMHRLTAGWLPDGAEWEAVVRHAGQIGATQPVGWGTWSAQRLVGLPVGDRVIDRLRGEREALDGMAERQWVLRCFASPAGSPSERWTRFWWRRAMRGLGDAGGQWPWALGRGALPPSVDDGEAEGARASRNRWSNWRRHLLRVLRS